MKEAAIRVAQAHPKKLIIGGIVVVAGVWISVAVVNRRREARDQKAVAFFSELQRDLAPDTAGLSENKAFDIRYWETTSKKLGKPIYMLTVAAAKAYASDVRNGFGWIFNDNDKIKSVFRALKDQVQVSQMAYQYYLNNPDKINLIDDLKSKMNKDRLGEVLAIVKKMPPYRLVESPKK